VNDSGRDVLRRLLLLNYDVLKAQLARRLGSADLAGEALQDTWLQLEGATRIGDVHRPQPYLLRIAYNIALKRRRSERDTVTLDDARAALSLVDDTPGPERAVEARSEIVALEEALAQMPPRRRAILLASRAEGVPLSEIATRFGISQRMIEIELKSALIHCGQCLGRKIVRRFGPKPPERLS
jgi:RNA polymerase sigma-70 factor (ECF subfamily)